MIRLRMATVCALLALPAMASASTPSEVSSFLRFMLLQDGIAADIKYVESSALNREAGEFANTWLVKVSSSKKPLLETLASAYAYTENLDRSITVKTDTVAVMINRTAYVIPMPDLRGCYKLRPNHQAVGECVVTKTKTAQ